MSKAIKKIDPFVGRLVGGGRSGGDGGAAAAAAANQKALAEADERRAAQAEEAKNLAAERKASGQLATREDRTRQRATAGGAVLTENDASFLQDNPPAKRKRATRTLLG